MFLRVTVFVTEKGVDKFTNSNHSLIALAIGQPGFQGCQDANFNTSYRSFEIGVSLFSLLFFLTCVSLKKTRSKNTVRVTSFSPSS